ncbi:MULTISPECIES: AAA family ATPase [Aeromonas]|uniref:AAA family ATPase n=1 Tax=Aeromonas TaxID=642 RepID=UPI001CCDF2D5|nr:MULTISPECIES: AAA family ATPase [Aeromonas]MCS3458287.1 putative ATPase [Aeromonas sp. BIGb0445]UBO72951.1 ATP-binding protein [Aeromonas rivuli]
MNHLIVFTGGPGSGKTTTIDCLKALGYQCVDEVGRKVILQQLAIDGCALPWMDKVAFRDEMIREELECFSHHQGNQGLVFFDRGIIDSYAYSKLEGLPIPSALLNTCHLARYHIDVFIFPPWESIYSNDSERKQSYAEAVDTYLEMVAAYQTFGYSLIEVPKASVSERVEFILRSLAAT